MIHFIDLPLRGGASFDISSLAKQVTLLAVDSKLGTANNTLTAISGKVSTEAKQDTIITALATLSTSTKQDDIITALGNLATDAKIDDVLTALGLISTEAKQDDIITALGLLAKDAKLDSILTALANLATSAKQDTTNTALGTLATEAKLEAVRALINDVVNLNITNMSAKLPPSLGTKSSAQSLSVTISPDDLPLEVVQPAKTGSYTSADYTSGGATVTPPANAKGFKIYNKSSDTAVPVFFGFSDVASLGTSGMLIEPGRSEDFDMIPAQMAIKTESGTSKVIIFWKV